MGLALALLLPWLLKPRDDIIAIGPSACSDGNGVGMVGGGWAGCVLLMTCTLRELVNPPKSFAMYDSFVLVGILLERSLIAFVTFPRVAHGSPEVKDS